MEEIARGSALAIRLLTTFTVFGGPFRGFAYSPFQKASDSDEQELDETSDSKTNLLHKFHVSWAVHPDTGIGKG